MQRVNGTFRDGNQQKSKLFIWYSPENICCFIDAVRYEKKALEYRAIIDAFVQNTKLYEEEGYVEPEIVCTTMARMNQYGWKATCPVCGSVCCIAYVHPILSDALLIARCNNIKQHTKTKYVYLEGDNPLIQEYVFRANARTKHKLGRRRRCH